jgi:hypothetical protein
LNYAINVTRGDGNIAWMYSGIVIVGNGKFVLVTPFEKKNIDVSVTSDGALTLSVNVNAFPDTWTITVG